MSWGDADKRFMQIISNVVASKTLEERNLILKNDFETFRIKIKFSLAQDFQIRIGRCTNDKTFTHVTCCLLYAHQHFHFPTIKRRNENQHRH